MTMQKNNGIGFFSTVFQAMVVFGVMANGTAAVDHTGNEHTVPKKTASAEEQLNQSQQKNNSQQDDRLMPEIYVNPKYMEIDSRQMWDNLKILSENIEKNAQQK
jgi:hypothetical protein